MKFVMLMFLLLASISFSYGSTNVGLVDTSSEIQSDYEAVVLDNAIVFENSEINSFNKFSIQKIEPKRSSEVLVVLKNLHLDGGNLRTVSGLHYSFRCKLKEFSVYSDIDKYVSMG